MSSGTMSSWARVGGGIEYRTLLKLSVSVSFENQPGVTDDPADHMESVMLEHAAGEPANSPADQRMDFRFRDLLDPPDPLHLGQIHFMGQKFSVQGFRGNKDFVRTIQPVCHTAACLCDAHRSHIEFFSLTGL